MLKLTFRNNYPKVVLLVIGVNVKNEKKTVLNYFCLLKVTIR